VPAAETRTKKMLEMERSGQRHRVVEAIWRKDENGEIYDLTRILMDELRYHPFGAHDDLIDAAARIYDMQPYPPELYERGSTDSLEQELEDCEQDL
jgi:hypothetical protein